MFMIGITNKLNQKLSIDMNVIPNIEPMDIYCWHADIFVWNRRNCIVIMNNRTRYCVMLYGLKKSDAKNMGSIFVNQLQINLINDGVSQKVINNYLDNIRGVYYTKTNSRSVLGSLNDIIYGITFYINKYYADGEFYQDKINSAVNDQVIMPLEKIGLPPFSNKSMKLELNRLFNNL